MLNHALVGSLLHTEAMPITDDPVHGDILNYKLQQVHQLPEISAVLADPGRSKRSRRLSWQLKPSPDFHLGAIPETVSVEDILAYRNRHSGEVQAARDKMSWMAREVTQQLWTKEFEDDVYHKVNPELKKAFEPVQSSWSSWLKPLGLALGGAAIVLGMFSNPLTPVAVGLAALTVAKEAGIGASELYQDWKEGKTQNGLHYLLRFKTA